MNNNVPYQQISNVDQKNRLVDIANLLIMADHTPISKLAMSTKTFVGSFWSALLIC